MKNSAFIKLEGESDSSYIDIFVTYGVSFLKGAYLKLLNTGEAKEYVTNESRIEHGTRYLASSTNNKIAEKKVSVDILMEAESMAQFITRYESFTGKISGGVVYLKIPSHYRVFKLVYSNISPKAEYRNKRAIFTLEFIEPNPKDRIVLTT